MNRVLGIVSTWGTLSLCGMLSACTELDLTEGWPSDTGWESDTAATLDDSGGADSAEATAAWAGVNAELELLEGAFASGQLRLTLYPEAPEDGALCEVLLPVRLAEAREQTPDPTVFHWWRLSLDAPTEAPACVDAEALPGVLMLGLGALHPELAPALARDGLSEVSNSLYGAYINLEDAEGDAPDDTAWLLGYAGTAADLAGEALAVEAAPLPDGRYTLRAWFLQRLTS